jgi:hypothetical protein
MLTHRFDEAFRYAHWLHRTQTPHAMSFGESKLSSKVVSSMGSPFGIDISRLP